MKNPSTREMMTELAQRRQAERFGSNFLARNGKPLAAAENGHKSYGVRHGRCLEQAVSVRRSWRLLIFEGVLDDRSEGTCAHLMCTCRGKLFCRPDLR